MRGVNWWRIGKHLRANPDATVEQIEDACRQAQLHDFSAGLPLNYETLLGENGLLLCGSERQRLATARAIQKHAPILILDKATANLGATAEQRLLESREHVDQVIELAQGRVTASVPRNLS